MKISVVMVDGEFRENTFGAEFFSKQNFPDSDFEVIWVEFYSNVPESVRSVSKVNVVTLKNSRETTYHSSLCFNKGIQEAKGELIVIPDADQVVLPDFLSKLWAIHSAYDRLVVYPYRYDEIGKGELKSFDPDELEAKCILKNPKNYGGCLSVRKKWLLEINGYEQHRIFESGFHANGLDIYTRFKNIGLAVMWTPDIRLYHPWHPNTLAPADQYKIQLELIDWRFRNLQYLAIEGIDAHANDKTFDYNSFLGDFMEKNTVKLNRQVQKKSFFKRLISRL